MFYDDIEDCSFWGNVKFFVSLPFIYLVFGLPMIWDWLVAKKRVGKAES